MMTNLEDELKSRFSNEKVSEGVDSDALWDEVASALDVTESPVAGTGWSAKSIGLVIITAFLVGSGIVYYYPAEDSQKKIQDHSLVADATVKKNEQEVNMTKTATKPLKTENKSLLVDDLGNLENVDGSVNKNESTNGQNENILTEEALQTSSKNNGKSLIPDASESKNGIEKSIDNQNASGAVTANRTQNSRDAYAKVALSENKKDHDAGVIVDMPEHQKNSIEVTKPNQSNKKSLAEKVETQSLSTKRYVLNSISPKLNTSFSVKPGNQVEVAADSRDDIALLTNDISIIPFRGISQRDRHIRFDDRKRDIDASNDFVIKRPLPIEIGLFTGVNTYSNHFSGSDNNVSANELNDSQKRLYGTTNTLMVYYSLKKNLTIGAGLEQNVLKNQFNLTRERVFLENMGNQLVEINVDPLSGDSNYVYEEQFVESMETRSVRHTNTLKFISIPIDISKKFTTQSFNYGFGLGLRFNLIQSQNGKFINLEDNIALYDGVGVTNQLYSKSFLSYHAQAYIEKSIGESLRIRLNPSIRLQQHGVSKLHGLKNNSILIGAQFGILYSF